MPVLFTAGTSNRTEEDVGELFADNRITRLVDIRSMRGSRTPLWDETRYGNVTKLCQKLGITYDPSLHVILGGLQNGRMTIKNFRQYAQTPTYASGIRLLKHVVLTENGGNAIIMCCERDYKQCHRRVIAETLRAEGWEVIHL